MLDAKEAEILVNNDKVGLRLSKKEARLRGDMNEKALFDAMVLYNLVIYTSEVLVLVALDVMRFFDVNPLSSRSFAKVSFQFSVTMDRHLVSLYTALPNAQKQF